MNISHCLLIGSLRRFFDVYKCLIFNFMFLLQKPPYYFEELNAIFAYSLQLVHSPITHRGPLRLAYGQTENA